MVGQRSLNSSIWVRVPAKVYFYTIFNTGLSWMHKIDNIILVYHTSLKIIWFLPVPKNPPIATVPFLPFMIISTLIPSILLRFPTSALCATCTMISSTLSSPEFRVYLRNWISQSWSLISQCNEDEWVLNPNDIGFGIGWIDEDRCCSFWNLWDLSERIQHSWQKSIVQTRE